MKRIFTIAAIAAVALSMLACSGKAGTIVWGTNAEFQPFEYMDGTKIVGIDADIAAAIASDNGFKLKAENMAFDSLLTALASGKLDFVAAGLTVNEERKQNVDFSIPYFNASQVIIVAPGSKVKAATDLATARVGVQQGTTGDQFVADTYKDARLDRYSKGFEAVQALLQGKLDAVVIDSYPAKAFVAQNPGLSILDELLTREEYAIAVKKGNEELLGKINATLAMLMGSGKMQEIFDAYIPKE